MRGSPRIESQRFHITIVTAQAKSRPLSLLVSLFPSHRNPPEKVTTGQTDREGEMPGELGAEMSPNYLIYRERDFPDWQTDADPIDTKIPWHTPTFLLDGARMHFWERLLCSLIVL